LRWVDGGAPTPEAAAEPSLGRSRLTGPRPDSATVLVADDNADMREYVSRLLQERWHVVAVPDGRAALAAATEERVDLVLSDIMMPGMNGFELLAALRAGEETATLPVILLSARAGEEARVAGLEAGADDYLIKPFTARELIARVETHVALATSRREREARDRYRIALNDALRGIRDALEIQATATRMLGEQLGANRVAYWETDGDEHVFRREYTNGVPSLASPPPALFTRTMVAALSEGRTIVSNDVLSDSAHTAEERAELARASIRAYVRAPLVKDGRLVGGLAVHAAEPRAWQPAEVQLVEETAARTWDAVERANAESALLEAEERLRLIADSVPSVLWTAAPDGTITYASEQWYAYFGLTPGENTNDWMERVLHPDDYERCRESWARALAEGTRYEIEVRNRRHDGVYRWFLTRAVAERDSAGRITGWYGSTTDIEDRKRIEGEIERQRADFYSLLMHAPIPMAVVEGPEFNIALANALTLQLLGRGEDVIGRPLLEAVPGLAGLAADELLRDVMATGEPASIAEAPIRLGEDEGGLHYFSFHYTPLANTTGVIDRVLAVAIDVTEEVRARQAIEEASRSVERQRSQLELLVDAAPLGVYLVDADFKFRQVNPTARRVLGGPTDLIGSDFSEVIHRLWPQEYADEFVRRFRHTLETGESDANPEHIEERLDRGVTEYYEWRIDRIPLPDGRNGVVCYFRDISAAVHARRDLIESEERFRSIFDQALGGIAQTSLDGRFLMVNDRYCEIVGRAREDLLETRMQDIVHPEDLSPNQDLLTAMLQRGGLDFELENRYIRPDGSTLWVNSSLNAIRNAAGEPLSIIAVSIDITDRKRVEEELKAANSQKDQFLRLVSHELRTPISTVIANGSVLLRRGDQVGEEDRRQALADIVSEAGRLQGIIENLLLLTRVDSGSLDFEPMSLQQVLSDQVEAFRRREPMRQVELAVESEPAEILAQPSLLAQVIDNLLGNAAKYSPPDASIEAILTTGPRGDPEVRIRDHGIGIEAADIANLFTPFYRSEAAKGYSPGMGLGLAVCKRIIEVHGGSIRASSGADGGAEFVFTLPARQRAPSRLATD
jgi:PAS domain S-box-containing protein